MNDRNGCIRCVPCPAALSSTTYIYIYISIQWYISMCSLRDLKIFFCCLLFLLAEGGHFMLIFMSVNRATQSRHDSWYVGMPIKCCSAAKSEISNGQTLCHTICFSTALIHTHCTLASTTTTTRIQTAWIRSTGWWISLDKLHSVCEKPA